MVYVVGAGLSAGLGFPTIDSLLARLWDRIVTAGWEPELSEIVRFHHPNFNSLIPDSYPNIERLLSEMQANAQLFASSRPSVGTFTSQELEARREKLLLELADWFHDLQATALRRTSPWLTQLIDAVMAEQAQIISFNWDLVLDQLLFGDSITDANYGFGRRRAGPRLIKPHGSLNWYEHSTGQHLKDSKKIALFGGGSKAVFAFKPYRAPRSKRRRYRPLIVPPEYAKRFQGPVFKRLWQETVSVLSTATEVRFLGYSLPEADFHARFILRCGFYNQEHGELRKKGPRAPATGRSKVVIVDPDDQGPRRVEDAVGWGCDWQKATIEDWITGGGLG